MQASTFAHSFIHSFNRSFWEHPIFVGLTMLTKLHRPSTTRSIFSFELAGRGRRFVPFCDQNVSAVSASIFARKNAFCRALRIAQPWLSNTLHFARALLEAMILETIGRKCGKRKNKKMFSNEMKLVNFNCSFSYTASAWVALVFAVLFSICAQLCARLSEDVDNQPCSCNNRASRSNKGCCVVVKRSCAKES